MSSGARYTLINESKRMRYIFADQDRNAQVKRIREGIEEFRNQKAERPEAFSIHEVYDDILLQLTNRFLEPWQGQIALAAQGGYGRKDMSPYSDIDMLFLRPDDAPEGIYRGIKEILYLLWDAKVEVGHSVRTIPECCEEAGKDLAVLTSLMDARQIWGHSKIFRRLQSAIETLLDESDTLGLYHSVEEELRKAVSASTSTLYLLQPNVKEGQGGLRQMQLTLWLSKMIFGATDLNDLPFLGVCQRKAIEEVKDGLQFLSEVRTRVHLAAGRRDDLLTFEAQFALAEAMGFGDTPERRGVERFMREYYRHTSTMDFFSRRVRDRVRLSLSPPEGSEIKRLKLDNWYYIGAGGINRFELEKMQGEPRLLLLAFRHIADTGCDLDIRLADKIRQLLRSMDSRWTEDPVVNAMFLEILRTRSGFVSKALNAMMKTAFLEWFIPEFQGVRFLRQHDAYHMYTVDLHTIRVLANIDSFHDDKGEPGDRLLRTIFAKLPKPEVLYLAGFFHDIGKGRGAGHEIRGEEIARTVLNRLPLSEEDVEDVCFLIRNHLAMTHLALRKDLHDESMLLRFAENVVHHLRLDMLVLLTHADLRAVGPTAYNSWKGHLIEELYYRTLDIIEGGDSDGEDLGDWLKQIQAVVKQIVPESERGERLDNYLAGAPSRYLLDFYPGIIVEHYLDLQSYLKNANKTCLGPEDMIVRKVDNRRPGYSAITLIVKDIPGLFFKIAGTLAANRINILSAWSHSIQPDIAVATFHVNDIPEGALNDPEKWDSFREDMGKILSGELDVHELVATRRRTRAAFKTPAPIRSGAKVEVDNAASDRATIVEVHSDDRPGLLYDITRKLSAMGLNIVLTKITTEANRAADIFYVVNSEDKKIVDFDRLDEIREELRDHLLEIEQSLAN